MRLMLLALVLAGMMPAQDSSKPKYLDLEYTPEERAADLASRMTLEEKVGQMQDNAPSIPRLGIPAYNWWNEALHGVARAGLATVFPQAIGLAATWDTDLEHRIADIISTEGRGKYNDAIAHDNHQRYHGLTFWSPNINIFRDPRWGRGQETYGEDPYLTSQMGIAFIQGMQGDDDHYLKTVATSKHFAVHSGPEESRHQFNVGVNPHDLENTYLPAFRATVMEGRAQSVMCAYNSVDGAPACANTMLLGKLRNDWKFSGYVVSDCGAIGDIYNGHHYADSMAAAAAKAVKAGTDLDCGTEYKSLIEAAQSGLIQENEINGSVERLFAARFRLGMFDPPEHVPFSKIGMDEVASAKHAEVALEAAEKSIVLLKNENHTLPLEKVPANIAVIGPAADDPDTLLGNYNGTPRYIVTPLAGIADKFGTKAKVAFAQGSVYASSSMALIPQSALAPPTGKEGEHGILAQYFSNDTLDGQPALSRVEPRVYFDWQMQNPEILRALPAPTFSVRWTAVLRAPATGDYDLGVLRQECGDCLGSNVTRLYLDGKTLINEDRESNAGNLAFRSTVHLEAGQDYQLKLEYVQREGGSGVELVWAPPPESLLGEAVARAKESQLAILCLGLNSRLEGEESPIEIPGFSHGDRTDIKLPEPQQKLLKAVLDTGTPVIVILINGSALAVQTAQERAQAILEAWYGGQEAGNAIAKTLSGENNPAGRLPVTFYGSIDQLPLFTDYSMKGRTYRYFKGKPLYPFGYGLSYSNFGYSDVQTKPSGDGERELSAHVTNRSTRDGDEVVQLYLKSVNRDLALMGFRRIHLSAGETKTVSFVVSESDLKGTTATIGGGQPVPRE
ncbi:MAG: glycoside hydrolase family 3 C-terminal domain-containing protein [Acidobacteriaceae bacterium]|nr:glycoside hydrolase family 3 C-terminal domain-containing protein [Acidobacteriaceae bacterium]MBV9499902.1 glycoside hydrolase family 3 C-terminal domain-containing protein [Acidobacteriaceae bacterium]